MTGHLGCGVAVVAYLDGDEPSGGQAGARGELAGGDADNGEVGQAAVAVDPVVEEPVEVLVRDFFQRALEAGGVAVEACVEAVGLQGLLEGVVADDGAEHPPDGGGLGAVEDVSGGGDQAGACGADGGVWVFRFGEGERAGGVLQFGQRGGAASGALGPEEREELGESLVDPGMGGVNPDVSEGVGERGGEGCGPVGAHGTDEECVVLEGLAGVVEDGEGGERLRAEPVGEEGLDQGGGGGVGGKRVVVVGDGGDEGGVGGRSGLAGGAVGDEEAGRAEAERLRVEGGGGDTGRFGRGQVGVVADGGERLAEAAEEGGVGRVARVLDGETEADGCGGLTEAGVAHGLEETRAVAEEDGRRGGGKPEDVAESAQGGERGRDGVPVGGEGLVAGRADAREALGGGRDCAGVERDEGEGRAGSEWTRERDDGFVHQAGVVGVGVDEAGGERKRSGRAAGNAAGG